MRFLAICIIGYGKKRLKIPKG